MSLIKYLKKSDKMSKETQTQINTKVITTKDINDIEKRIDKFLSQNKESLNTIKELLIKTSLNPSIELKSYGYWKLRFTRKIYREKKRIKVLEKKIKLNWREIDRLKDNLSKIEEVDERIKRLYN